MQDHEKRSKTFHYKGKRRQKNGYFELKLHFGEKFLHVSTPSLTQFFDFHTQFNFHES